MLKRLISFALAQPLILFLLTALFIAGGIAAFQSLPIEAFPDVTDVQVTIISLFPGHAAEEVEKQVTVPLEIEMSGLPHSTRMFSHTQFGLSYLVLTFDDQVDNYFARQQVLERLHDVDLPSGVQPQLAPLTTPAGELYRYHLTGENLSPMDLRTLQDWVVARYLKMTPGVGDVVSRGGFVKQHQVSLDLARMKAYGVSMQQILTALDRGNANAGGSYLEQGEQQYLIRGIGLLRSSEDIGNVIVAERNGTPILVKDIAEVGVGAVPRQGLVGKDDEDEIVTGIVLMRKGENPSAVLAALKERVTTLNASILPQGVQIVPYYDRTWLIHTTLKTVFENLLEGALLVSLVLYLFLGHLRSAAIVAAIIPLALLSTFIGLKLRGIPANLLSLGAMDFGIIVDGAVIVVENIFRQLSEHSQVRDREALRATVLDAAVQVGRPTLFSMLIIIAAHIPIFTLQRHEGRIFAPMAYTVTSALVGSLLFSLTLVPLLCFFLLRKRLPEKENFLVSTCKRAYRPALTWALHHHKTVLVTALAALVVSLLLVPSLGTEFLPELNEGTVWVNATLPSSISVSEAAKICARMRAILRRFPEVVSVVSQAGRPEDGTDPKPISMTEHFVDLKPPAQWTRRISKEQLIEEMDEALAALPGVTSSFSQPIRDNVLESISQIDGQIVIKIFAQDGALVREKAQEVLQAVTPVRGVARAFIDRAGEVPQLQVEVDRQRAARYGLNVADIQDVIETALGGKVATEMWEGEKRFGVVVRLLEEERRDVAAIKNILVDAPGGMRIPLEQVATVTVQSGSMNISREGGMRVAALGVFIRGRDMGSVVQEMQQRVQGRVSFPPGCFVTWGGEFENQQRAMARLLVIVPISVLLIFVLLFNAFGSGKSALLILSNVPFALIGGIFALLLTGIPLSVSAAIGFIALFGQAVLNGVVMVSYFNQLREGGATPFDAVVQGALVRLRTVLMTALLAMLGLLPMALSHGIGSEVQKPLAVVIIGGLLSATALTLIVLPALYLLLEDRRLGTVLARSDPLHRDPRDLSTSSDGAKNVAPDTARA
ncbi:MAG TPA: CusA/CzcA family heavy metal efflux RND transporter [Candidatus Binatia bacterium]|nr:CusA/CzcA family heavy metal efflux RND transporter [Candidatus Binatia bacterium]